MEFELHAPAVLHPGVRALFGSHQSGQADRVLALSRIHGEVSRFAYERGNSDFVEVEFADGAQFGVDWAGREYARN